MNRLLLAMLLTPAVSFGEVIDFENSAAVAEHEWTVAMTGRGRPARWEVVSDGSSSAGSRVFAQGSTHRKFGRFPLAIYRPAELTDGTVSVKFKAVSGAVDSGGGLIWRLVDANNYYVVRASIAQDNVVVMRCQDGRRRTIGRFGRFTRDDDFSPSLDLDQNGWNTLEVVFEGPHFAVSLNGLRLLDIADATFIEPGKVGLWTHGDSVTHFDAFEVAPE